MFVWTEKYNTHINEVDEQHKKLVAILNRIYAEVEEETLTADRLDKLLEELTDYTDYHFTDEEQLMERKRVSAAHIKLHKMEHQAFIYDIKRLQAKRATTASVAELGQQAASFVMNWLALHILGIDQSYANQVRAIEDGMSPQEAYEKYKDYTYERQVTRNLVRTLLEMWRDAEDRVLELRQK